MQPCHCGGGRSCIAPVFGACNFQLCSTTSECPRGELCADCEGDFVIEFCNNVSACTGNCAGADACQGPSGQCPGGERRTGCESTFRATSP
jgi:hypothetical protein